MRVKGTPSNSNLRRLAPVHGCCNILRNLWKQPNVPWKVKGLDAVALKITARSLLREGSVGKHGERSCADYRVNTIASVAR